MGIEKGIKLYQITYDNGVTANWTNGKLYQSLKETKDELSNDGFVKSSLGWYEKECPNRGVTTVRAFINVREVV